MPAQPSSKSRAPVIAIAARQPFGRVFARLGRTFLFALGALADPSQATGQVGAVLSAYTDFRFRGLSLSDGQPVGLADLSYDHSSGIYGALSGSIVATRHDGLKPLGLTVNAGYAHRVGRNLSLDLGAVHSRYSRYSGGLSEQSYTELYAGLSTRFVGTRFAVSPDYLGSARWTLHGELNGHLDAPHDFSFDASVGALIPLRDNGYQGSGRSTWDVRLGVAKRVGPLSIHGALTARGKGGYYGNYGRGRTAIILGLSTAL